MSLYQRLCNELQEITIYHWIRIGLCGFFTYNIMEVILPRLITMYFIRRSLDVYHIATIFNETGKTQESINITLDALIDTVSYELAWYFILSIIVCAIIWKWFGLPKKIWKKGCC